MIAYKIEEHNVAYPSNVLAQHYAEHMPNIRLNDNLDNGWIVRKGAFIDLDLYEEAEAFTMEGIIRKKAPNGNWYVEITANPDRECFVYVQPYIAEDWTNKWKAERNFYNEAGTDVRSYVLAVGDTVEEGLLGFEGVPEEGKKVTVSNKKFKVEE